MKPLLKSRIVYEVIMVCNNKDVRKYVRSLEKIGWSIIKGKRHPRLLHPGGKRWISISCTPRDKGYLRVLKGRVNLLINFG